jgi:ribose transport system substrate-binding protein
MHRFVRKAVLASAMVALVGTAAACSSSTSSTANSTAGAAGSSAKSGGTIGFAQADFGNGWYEIQDQGVLAEAKKLGYKVDLLSGNADPTTQISQIQNFITEGVKAVIINPTDPQALAPALTALRSAKIPFVLVNSPLAPSLASEAYCYVSENQAANAAADGVQMAKSLIRKYGSGATVKALLVEGYPGALDAVLRHQGFLKGYQSVPGAPKLNLLPSVYGHWAASTAVAPVQSVATANPDIKAVFVETDSMMPGVQTALTAAGLWNKVTIASYDGRMTVVKYMLANPSGPIISTVANLPYDQGTVGVQVVQKALTGVPSGNACPGGQYVMPPTVVTPQNAASHYSASSAYVS